LSINLGEVLPRNTAQVRDEIMPVLYRESDYRHNGTLDDAADLDCAAKALAERDVLVMLKSQRGTRHE
jgi:hypothetical protein